LYKFSDAIGDAFPVWPQQAVTHVLDDLEA